MDTLYSDKRFYLLFIESVRHIQIVKNLYIHVYKYFDSTSLHMSTPVPQSILRSTIMGHVYNPAARQIFESALN